MTNQDEHLTEIPSDVAEEEYKLSPLPPSIPGGNILLMGDTGTGKTHVIRTLIEAGITPFVLATEPGIASTLGDVPPDKLHWHYVGPATVSWGSLIDTAKKINTLSYEALAKSSNINKKDYAQWISLLTAFNNFTCDRTGESFGDVGEWGPDRALILDTLTGASKMAMDLVVGSKPTASPGDWGVAMKNLENALATMTNNTRCWFILTAHLEREKDEVTGAVKLMPSALGQKLSPKIPRNFDDVIQCVQEQARWSWNTASTSQIDLKARYLPVQSGLAASFVPLVEAWKKKGGRIES